MVVHPKGKFPVATLLVHLVGCSDNARAHHQSDSTDPLT